MKIYNLSFLLLFLYPFVSPIPDNQQILNKNKQGAANIVFKSSDGGQTWQDISEGLPENLEKEYLLKDDFFATESGLHLRAGTNGIYHSKPNSTAPYWEKEDSPHEQGSIAFGKSGIFAYNNDGQFLQKINGTSVWSPIYSNFKGGPARTVFETSGGTVFIASTDALFKSTNKGKTWKQVQAGWIVKLVESNGILMAASENGIIRSTDDGENWVCVLNVGGVGIDIEPIKGGFASVIGNRELMARTVQTTYDEGKNWQYIDASLPPSLDVTSIIELGENLFCGHPNGILRSSDKGKTWKLILPSINNKVFSLVVSGNVIYAIPVVTGC